MKPILNCLTVFIAAVLLCSCGTSKKLASANTEIQRLNSVVADQSGKLAANEKEISQLKTENIQYGKEAEDCRKLKEALVRKKEKLDKALAERGTSLKEIEEKAEVAVQKFRDAGCDVTYKNGRFHVSVSDTFNYKSGAYKVGPKGREALNVVAQVMYDNPGVLTMVVGHTDTTHVNGVADNWSLSTERSLAVVRLLEDLYHINPSRLTAAGRSKFNPIASNDTPEGRAKNRRIEFIINADLDRLWNLTDDDSE